MGTSCIPGLRVPGRHRLCLGIWSSGGQVTGVGSGTWTSRVHVKNHPVLVSETQGKLTYPKVMAKLGRNGISISSLYMFTHPVGCTGQHFAFTGFSTPENF